MGFCVLFVQKKTQRCSLFLLVTLAAMSACLLCSACLIADKRRRKIHSSSSKHIIQIFEKVLEHSLIIPADAYLCRGCYSMVESIDKLREELFKKETIIKGRLQVFSMQRAQLSSPSGKF